MSRKRSVAGPIDWAAIESPIPSTRAAQGAEVVDGTADAAVVVGADGAVVVVSGPASVAVGARGPGRGAGSDDEQAASSASATTAAAAARRLTAGGPGPAPR
jgi:hypothetical protein